MSDQPAVTPAAPVIDPAAPAAPVVPTPAALAATVAPIAPVPPVVDPAAPVAPVAAPAVSLVPEPSAAPAALVPDPAGAKWYLAENIAGQGEIPLWFKADKYKSVDAQAQAYPELEKRFGAFTGSPKDGVYKINIPTDVPVEFDTSHALFQELNKFANDSQFSQEAYDGLISMFARYEASIAPDMNQIKQELGDNADARLNSVAQWAKSNLPDDLYKSFRIAQTQSNAADTFKVIEAIIAKTRSVALPKPGEDVLNAVPAGLEEIKALQIAVYTEGEHKGKRKYLVDQSYREMVEKKNIEYHAALQQ